MVFSLNVNFLKITYYCTSYFEHFWKILLLNINFSLNGSEIEIEKEFNYLRIPLNRTDNFHKAITKQAEKVKKKRLCMKFWKEDALNNLSVEWQLQLFDKIVKPIFLYGSEIWGFSKHIDCLEKYSYHFVNYYLLLNLKLSTPNYMTLRYYCDDFLSKLVSFWGRLLLGKETKLSYLSYKLLCMLWFDENVDFVWIKYLKTAFDDTGYSVIWRNQDFPNSNWLIRVSNCANRISLNRIGTP